MNKLRFLTVFLFCTIFAMWGLTQAHAYSTGMSSADQFRAESCDIYQLITINYTQIGATGSSIAIIRSDGCLAENVQANAAGNLGGESRIELIPDVRSVWSKTGGEIIAIPGANYDNASYLIQRTYTNNTVSYLNVTESYNNASIRSQERFSGNRYQYILLPPYDVAYHWCQKNNAVLNSVDNVNMTIDMNERLVDLLVIQASYNMTPDLNLDDGYSGYPTIGGIANMAEMICRIVLIVAIVTIAVIWALTGYTPFDFSSNPVNNPSQDVNVGWNLSDDANWDAYEAICNASGIEPTFEGFMEYLKTLGDLAPVVTPTWNNNWTNAGGASNENVLTSIVAFIQDLLPLIIAIIIVIAFVVGFVMIYRFAKRFMSPS